MTEIIGYFFGGAVYRFDIYPPGLPVLVANAVLLILAGTILGFKIVNGRKD